MSAACRERSLPLRAAWLQLPVTRTAHHSEDVTYKQVTGYIQCITLNHDPGLNPVDVEVFWTGYWDDNLPDTDPDTGYPLKPGSESECIPPVHRWRRGFNPRRRTHKIFHLQIPWQESVT